MTKNYFSFSKVTLHIKLLISRIFLLQRSVQHVARVPNVARDVFENGTRAVAKSYSIC